MLDSLPLGPTRGSSTWSPARARPIRIGRKLDSSDVIDLLSDPFIRRGVPT
jgi:hypothetical protein